MTEMLMTQRVFLDPNTGQEFLEIDPLRSVVGSGSVLVTLAAGDVTLLTVPAGKKFVMTNYKVSPIGIGIAQVTRIFNGASAGADLRVFGETIAASLRPLQESGIQTKLFDDDVVATCTLAAGAYIEVGGFFIDTEPAP